MRGGRRKALAAGAAALLLVPLLSDFIQWSLWRQGLQRRVDDAALAGVRAIRTGAPVEPEIRRELAAQRSEPAVVEHPPRDGAFAGRPEAVRVRLSVLRSPFFHGRLFGPSPMRASATAAAIAYRDGSTRAIRVE